AKAIAFDAGDSGLASANVQDVILEINTKLDGTTDSLVDLGNGTYTHTSIDGEAVTFDVNSTKVEVLNGVYTFYDGNKNIITSIDTNVSADTVAFDAGESELTSANVQDAIDELASRGASNGLKISGIDVRLGGDLTEATSIQTTETNTLGIKGLQKGTGTEYIVVADQTTGVLKQVKAAMPKFFYMPSIVFEVSTTGTFTKNLHQLYVDQYGSPMISSTGANNSIPTFDATELEYHITYYDETLFNNITINENGEMTYTVLSSAVTTASFMNI